VVNSRIEERNWRYDPGEKPKRKHAWSQPHAGFVKMGGHLVGKCPKGLTLEVAETLLNDGIEEEAVGRGGTHPQRIYVVHEGVLYRAVPTLKGISYHAFPELPKGFKQLDDELKRKIWDRAKELGQEKELKQWLRRTW